MNREVTLRQITFMYLFISLSTVLRQIPETLAEEAGRSGYLSPIWSVIATVPLTAIIILLIKSYPGLNIYEIMVHSLGKFLSKIIILLYMLWIFLCIIAKVTIYSLTLQFTLMPKTRSDFFMVILAILVFYALIRGVKTIFRFSELTLGTILILFAIMFICAIGRIRSDYLLPVSTINLKNTVMASKQVIVVGGNIIIALFFADKFGISVTKEQIRKLWFGIITFTVLAFIITLFTFGISGTSLTKNLPFPFYITVKSISFFNIFERFEVLVTLICVLSDFIAICIFAILLIRCFEWLFNIQECNILFVPLTVIVFYMTYYVSSTQFEFNFLYRNVIVNLNLIFEFAIPFLLAFVCLIKRKKIKKQF
ncbi:MAG: GerAB/ArcD/ProY family transporter [Herbinix sp.]|nr:GerAB/ArcD/ProY family transporter [Herbinix sp.]